MILSVLMSLTVIILATVYVDHANGDNLLYPWGQDLGDQPGQRFGTEKIKMTKEIKFFKESYSKISLCSGGRIGFRPYAGARCGIDDAQSSPYMQTHNWTNIAVFGVTQNLHSNSTSIFHEYRALYYYGYYEYEVETLWYRVTQNRALRKKAQKDVRKNFGSCHNNFKPKELFIATWSDVHDLDFCATQGLEEPYCTCIIKESPFNWAWYWIAMAESYSYTYCKCIHDQISSPLACACNAYNSYNIPASLPPGVNYTYCNCMSENYNNEDFCDCEVYGICNDTKRELFGRQYKREVQESNTYQVVLMTDGRQTYAMFNYLEINWIYINTFGWKEYKYYFHPARVYAEVGFEREKGLGYHHPYSASDDLYKLVTESNVGIPGRWMYKISGGKIVSPGCKRLPFDF